LRKIISFLSVHLAPEAASLSLILQISKTANRKKYILLLEVKINCRKHGQTVFGMSLVLLYLEFINYTVV